MKKLLSLLFLLFGFFFFGNSFAGFVEVGSGYVSHNSFPYYSNVFVIPFGKYAIKVHNFDVEVLSYDLKQKYSTCKIHYNASWQSIFYLYFSRVNHLVLFSHSDGHSCYAMSLVDIDLSNGNCKSLDGFYDRSADKCLDDTSNGNLVLAYDKDNFYVTDKGNSDYGFIVTPTSTGIDYTGLSVGFQKYVKGLTFLDVGSAKLFGKSNNNIIDGGKSFYGVFEKDLGNTNNEILYLYNTNSILSYSPNTSTIQQRYYLTGSNLFVQGSVYNRTDKSEFIFNSANSVFTGALTYHYDSSEFGKYTDNFVFPYTSTLRFASPYSDFVKSGSNLGGLFYDSTDFNVYYSYYDLSGNYFYSVYSLESTGGLLNTESMSDGTSSSFNTSTAGVANGTINLSGFDSNYYGAWSLINDLSKGISKDYYCRSDYIQLKHILYGGNSDLDLLEKSSEDDSIYCSRNSCYYKGNLIYSGNDVDVLFYNASNYGGAFYITGYTVIDGEPQYLGYILIYDYENGKVYLYKGQRNVVGFYPNPDGSGFKFLTYVGITSGNLIEGGTYTDNFIVYDSYKDIPYPYGCYSFYQDSVTGGTYGFTGECPVRTKFKILENLVGFYQDKFGFSFLGLNINPLGQLICTLNVIGYGLSPTPNDLPFMPKFTGHNVIPEKDWGNLNDNSGPKLGDVFSFILLFILILTYILRLGPTKEE